MAKLKRFASHLTFCMPQKLLRQSVIEQDEDNRVTRIFSLNDGSVESAHTLFFDGVLSIAFVSLKHSLSQQQVESLSSDFQYVDLSVEPIKCIEKQSDKKLILDFGTVQPNEINKKLRAIAHQLSQFTLIEIIGACTYYPSVVLGIPSELAENERFNLFVWEGADLLNKKITDLTTVRRL